MNSKNISHALSILEYYSCDEKLSMLYDDEHYKDLADAIHVLFSDFEYPDFSYKTIREIMKEAYKMHAKDTEKSPVVSGQDSTREVLVDAFFISTWDDGSVIETTCKLNVTTGEAVDIEQSDEEPDCELESQCVLYVDSDDGRHFFEIDEDRYEYDNETFVEDGELERIKIMFAPTESAPHPGF